MLRTSPDEVISRLQTKLNVSISKGTLLRYANQRLIPLPERGSYGRAEGRWAEYPEDTIEQAYASWSMLHGEYGDEHLKILFEKAPRLSPFAVAAIRECVISVEQQVNDIEHSCSIDYLDKLNTNYPLPLTFILRAFTYYWYSQYKKAETTLKTPT